MDKKNAAGLVFITRLWEKLKGKGLSNQIMVILIAACLFMITVPESCYSGQAQSQQTPAETSSLNGAALLEARCSICHSADKPKKAKKTPGQWEQTVARMIDKGAKLTDAEKMMLVDYLAKAYGP